MEGVFIHFILKLKNIKVHFWLLKMSMAMCLVDIVMSLGNANIGSLGLRIHFCSPLEMDNRLRRIFGMGMEIDINIQHRILLGWLVAQKKEGLQFI